MIDRRISIAPMMDHTDRHFRFFMRLLSKHTVLYTEMITTGAIIHGDRNRFLQFNNIEHPLAIQLGGSDPDALTTCAQIAEAEGYDEVNLNIGCPSDRVQNGQFGACLMAQAELVAECVNKIQSRIRIPVTVKTRIGIDDHDSYDFLLHFIEAVHDAGCNAFIIHARKAILSGLSPKENREIPPLNYDRVHQLKKDLPHLNITINGGITDIKQIEQQLTHVDGVMLGRIAYQNPYMLTELDSSIFGESGDVISRKEVLERYFEYIKQEIKQGIKPSNMTRHVIGLYQGQPGAKQYRRMLSDGSLNKMDSRDYLSNLIQLVPA